MHGLVRVYVTGAISVMDDKNTYHAKDGVIEVPQRLVAQVLALGGYLAPDPAAPAADEKQGLATVGDLAKVEPDPVVSQVGATAAEKDAQEAAVASLTAEAQALYAQGRDAGMTHDEAYEFASEPTTA